MNIIEIAKEAGFDIDEGLFPFEASEDKFIGTERTLERFAALVAAHEREACAEVCDRFAENEAGFVAEDCAAEIRARDEK